MTLNQLNSVEAGESFSKREKWKPEPQKTETGEIYLEFDKWHGYYRKIPELQGMIERLAKWVVFGGDDSGGDMAQEEIEFKTEQDRKKFERISGYGKDTPEDVLINLFRMGKIVGTSVAEIIKTKKKGLVNLKPIDPGTIKVHQDKYGFLKEFELVTAKPGSGEGTRETGKKIPLDKMFYMAWGRIADEGKGISTIEKMQDIIDYRHQAMEDLAETFHRYVVPYWVFYVNEDDPTEIEKFNQKIKKIFEERGRNHLTIPEETVSKHERLAVPQYAVLNPLDWIKHLERYFLMSEGVPEIIGGIGRETADASSRMIYLAWRIMTIAHQKVFEKHIKRQLGIDLKLPRPINILAPEITERRTELQPPRDKEDKRQREDVNN